MSKLNYVNVEKIKVLSKEKGIKLKYYADKFGKNRGYITQISNGQDRMSAEELAFIARELDVSEDYLLDKTEDPAREPVRSCVAELTDLAQSMTDEQLQALVAIARQMKK